MIVSQNGYPANDISLTAVYHPIGPDRPFRMRKGACAEALSYVIRQFHARVQLVNVGTFDDWSYAERPVRGGTDLSNHASGTAVDLNASLHPLGTSPSANFSEHQIATIYTILNEVSDVVRWGGSYTGRQDPMHFEINAPESRVSAVVANLGSVGPILEDEDVALTDAEFDKIATLVWAKVAGGLGDSTHSYLPPLHNRVAALAADVKALGDKVDALVAHPAVVGGSVDVDALADTLAAKLAARLAT